MNSPSSGSDIWQSDRRTSKRWRYDYEWLVEKYESGWSVMDLAHFDRCAPGTIEYHLERAGAEVDGWGTRCPEFQADLDREHAARGATA